jgi:hypothetical protein
MLRRLARRRSLAGLLAAAALLGCALPAGQAVAASSWVSMPSPGQARQEVSYVHLDGKLYLAGGGTAHQAYDPQTRQWSNVKPLPQALDHIQGVAVGGRIYYLGGLLGWPSPESGTVYIYDPAKDSFTTGASMGARARGAGGVAVFDGRIYYAGGLHGGAAVNWFDVYDPQANSWTALPDMPTARDHFHAVVLDGRFWAIGGRSRDIGATTTANEAFAFASGGWATGSKPLPTPRGGFAAAAHGDEVVVIGGEDASKAHATVEAYNVKTDAWRTLEPMPVGRHGIQAATCNGGFYIAGGGTSPGHHPSAYHDAFLPGGASRPCGGGVAFQKRTLSGAFPSRPTSLQFGPDGRLYVALQDGRIMAYAVTRSATGSYSVTATEAIDLIHTLPNRDDRGGIEPASGAGAVPGRLVTGLLVTGTASAPVIYVTSSDPRIGAGPEGSDLDLDTNSGIVSRLTRSGVGWSRQDLVRGLPRSEENHTANGLALSRDGTTLYVAQGGNTNKGAPSSNFALLPEYALSAAILSMDLAAIGNGTHDLPTLDDPTRAGSADANDPFGGNDGLNQAKLVAGGPVKIHAPGFRNPYDVLIAGSGAMYTIDNGGNAGWGDVPQGEGPGGACTNAQREPGVTERDGLHRITGPGYFGGHPNPTRANKANLFGGQTPVAVAANPVECDFRSPGDAAGAGNAAGALISFPSSTNGLTEYTATNFGGAMSGDLLAAAWDNTIQRIRVESATGATASALVSDAGGGGAPLDVTAQGDGDPFPGTIWYVDIYNGGIYVLEPADYGGEPPPACDPTSVDADGDGFTHDDEILNGTDPCSPADHPPDADGDKVSDRKDGDDDGDGTADVSDPFARDPRNGLGTSLPVELLWENDGPPAGGLLNLGFTGLMLNGTDYLDQFDPGAMTAGGAAGVVTLDAVDDGDAYEALNSQRNGFQLGVDARPAAGPFTVHTRIVAPFDGVTPQNYQSMGMFIGPGGQDDYLKITTAHIDGPVVEVLEEIGGQRGDSPSQPLAMPGPSAVDLYLRVDPERATVQPSFVATVAGSRGPRVNVGPSLAVPPTWFTAPGKGLAVGIISTSNGPGGPFPATWDFLRVTPARPAPPTGLRATAGDGMVELDWSDGTEPDIAGYDVHRSGGGDALVSSQGPVSAYLDRNVRNGTTYSYFVRARGADGDLSAPSAAVSATPTAATSPAGPSDGSSPTAAGPAPGGSTAAAAPAPAGGPATGARKAVTVAVRPSRLRTALRRGLRLRLSCPGECRVSGALFLNRTRARRLGLGLRTIRVARGAASLTSRGTKSFRLRFSARARRRLGAARAVTLTLRLTIRDAGERTLQRRTVRLRR